MASSSTEIPHHTETDVHTTATRSLYGTNEEPPGSPTPSDDGSMHSSAEHSDTSTLKYDQEPYHLFKVRVEKLCHVLWSPQKSIRRSLLNGKIAEILRVNKFLNLCVPSQEAPLIERLGGGDYNRIVGIVLTHSKRGEHGDRDLILRVPRWDQGQIERVVATLTYLRLNSSIPIANVVAKDFGSENPLGSPYVIQGRIAGRDLQILWDDLNHPQRCAIARELGRVVGSLLQRESPVTGHIETAVNGTLTAKQHTVVPFDLKSADGDAFDEPEPQNASMKESLRERQTTLDFFKCQIGRWRAVDVARNAPMVDRTVGLWDGMLKAAEEMNDSGLFKSDRHCLCHVDLHPRNIMAEIHPDGSIQVTGILDWDEAVVAPKFVNCEPPGWLWGFDPDGPPRVDSPAWPYEIPGASDVPSTAEEQELKRIFVEHAGAEYCSLAYEEHFRLSRGLFRIAVFGLTSG